MGRAASPIAEFLGVSKSFGSAPAVHEVSFAIARGEFFSLLGPSGCGKTTTLRLLAGLESPDAGDIRLGGASALPLRPYERKLGMVFQSYALFPHLTVERNVAFGLERRRVPAAEAARRVAEALTLVRLDPGEFGRRRPAQLSGGQRQRMALARALAVEPKVLLLDEPFGALDARVRKELRTWLRRLHEDVHVTTVLVTHDQEEAMDVADRIVLMNEGRIEQTGKPRDLYEHPASEFVMGFVGPVNRFDNSFVRPHDFEIELEPDGTSREGIVKRVVHLGFEVRVEVALPDDNEIWIQLSRERTEDLDLEPGRSVFIRPEKTKVFA
jgi:sulfate transport system ATP-binding protein